MDDCVGHCGNDCLCEHMFLPERARCGMLGCEEDVGTQAAIGKGSADRHRNLNDKGCVTSTCSRYKVNHLSRASMVSSKVHCRVSACVTIHVCRSSDQCRTTTACLQASDVVTEGCSTDLCIDFDVQTYKVTAAVAGEFILHAGIPSAPALQLIKEVGHNLQRTLPVPPQNKNNSAAKSIL